MAGITPNEGRAAAGRIMYNDNVNRDLRLRLFANDITPGPTTVLADLTEVAGNGYAAKDLVDGDVTVNANGTLTGVSQGFTASGGSFSVYGWYLTVLDESAVERLLHVERDGNAGAGSPIVVEDAETYQVDPTGAVAGGA